MKVTNAYVENGIVTSDTKKSIQYNVNVHCNIVNKTNRIENCTRITPYSAHNYMTF